MSDTTEAFARVKIDALLKDAGWNLTDGSSVLFEHALPDGTQADYVLCDRQGRPMAALEAKRATTDPIAARDQGCHYAEQRRIVGILNRAARIERLRRRAQKRLREFIPALFVRMFGDPVENPMGWEIKPLGDFCLLTQYGTSKRANDQGDGIPVLRMGNVTYDGDLDCADLKHVVLPNTDIRKYGLRPGDIMFNRTNSKDLVGKTGLWDARFPAVAASYLIRLRLDELRGCPTFVLAFLNSTPVKGQLFAMARGAIGQVNINAKELRALPLPVPPLDEQRSFARIAEAARNIGNLAAFDPFTATLSESIMFRLLGTEP